MTFVLLGVGAFIGVVGFVGVAGYIAVKAWRRGYNGYPPS
jgi:succinate-acetate transporter protein